MRSMDVCPDTITLSSYLDHELSTPDNERVKLHVEECAVCTRRLQSIGAGTRQFLNLVKVPSLIAATSGQEDCVPPSLMTDYVHGLVSEKERERVENHLDSCDFCLDSLKRLTRTEEQLSRSEVQPLPNSLRERVISLWNEKKPEKDLVLRLAVRFVRGSLQVIGESLFPPTLPYQEILSPAGTYRNAEGQEELLPYGILVKKNLQGLEILITVERSSQDKATLKIEIKDEASNPLKGMRIFLRQDKILLHSDITDESGCVAVTPIEPGCYQLAVPSPEKEFCFDLEIIKSQE